MRARLNLPGSGDLDVLVVGGGPAGIGAGLAAARTGAKTLLVERWGFLGGLATGGFFTTLPVDRGMGAQDYSGLMGEILADLRALEALDDSQELVKTEILYNDDVLKSVLARKAAEDGLTVLTQCRASGAIVEGEGVSGVIVETKKGRFEIPSRVTIDCTGDADIAVSAGAAFEGCPVEPLPKISLFFRLGEGAAGLDKKKDLQDICVSVSGEAPYGRLEHRPFMAFSNLRRPGDNDSLTGSAAIFGYDGLEPLDLAESEAILRRYILDCLIRIKEEIPDMHRAYLAATPPAVSVEATRRVIGEYVLSGEDVKNGAIFDDTIALSSSKGIHAAYFKALPPEQRRQHGIPYRSLIPQKVDGLLVAGRCFSSTHEAHDGHPYIPTCLLMGQGAGTAAALAARERKQPRDIDPKAIQARLKEQGVNLG
jgi:hypothetical protein